MTTLGYHHTDKTRRNISRGSYSTWASKKLQIELERAKRICSKCGSNETYNNEWTHSQLTGLWLCNRCFAKEYRKLYREEYHNSSKEYYKLHREQLIKRAREYYRLNKTKRE